MRSLLDVNVLIAMLDADHSMHVRATRWFADHAESGWASCPLTQNGCVRIMSHPRYPGTIPVARVAERLGEATASPRHEFWPDDISILDFRVFNNERIHGPKQITDIYLLALAQRHGGRFVTFDGGVNTKAVHEASKEALVII